MCEKNHCSRTSEDLCTCMDWQNGDLIRTVTHLAENITDIDWELDYKDLADVQGQRLCLVGRCKKCGGRLCISQTPKIKTSPEQILSVLDDSIGQAYSALRVYLRPEEYYDKFTAMFHEEDQPFVKEWLLQREMKANAEMKVQKAYTIIHRAVYADCGAFPVPDAIATFFDETLAVQKMRELVEKEKDEMNFPYKEDLYCEEYDSHFWEAYCKDYAAGWFTRYEIMESPVCKLKGDKNNARI